MSRHLIKSRASEVASNHQSKRDLLETKSVMFDQSQFISESPGNYITTNNNKLRKITFTKKDQALLSQTDFGN